jgi:predicted nucleic acid-binding protein
MVRRRRIFRDLRNVPAAVEKAIRAKARQKRISIDQAVVELLEERVGVPARKTAASAMQYGLAVVTLDAHFARIPQILTHLVEE